MTAGRHAIGCDLSPLVECLRHFVLIYRAPAVAWVYFAFFCGGCANSVQLEGGRIEARLLGSGGS